jgi:hypothetical protein
MSNQIDRKHLANIGVITMLQGRPYLNHDGLLMVAHDNGLASIETELISWDPEARAAVVKATATGTRGTFSDYGDANPDNVNRAIASACLRMASTRSVSRCLRLYLGIGLTCTSELPGNRGEARAPQSPPVAGESFAQSSETPEEQNITPLAMLRTLVKGPMEARLMSELDMLARYFRRVPDTGEPMWDSWQELEDDPDGPEWALGKIRRLTTQEGLKPKEILQAAIDAHGGE